MEEDLWGDLWLDDWLEPEELSWDEEWEQGRMIWDCDMPVHLSQYGEVVDLTAEAA